MPDDTDTASETPTAAFRRGDHQATVHLLLEERKEHRQQFGALAKDVSEIKAVMVGDMTGEKPGLGARVTALETRHAKEDRILVKILGIAAGAVAGAGGLGAFLAKVFSAPPPNP